MAGLLLPLITHADPHPGHYRIQDLGVVPTRSQSWVINSRCLNERGEVVGWSNDGGAYEFAADSAFRWSNRRGLEPLQPLAGAASATATAINNRGQIVGMSGDPYPHSHPVVWNSPLPTRLVLPSSAIGGAAVTINDQGTIAGTVTLTDGKPRAIVWERGEPRLLPILAGPGIGEGAYTINDRGLVVGQSAGQPAMWRRREVVGFGTFGGSWGQANGCNNRGEVVGGAAMPDQSPHGFYWNGGEKIDLTPTAPYGFCLAINDRGQIVGTEGNANLEAEAILWERGQRILLDSVLPSGSAWKLFEADWINESGQIAGLGLLAGAPRVFLLTPRENGDSRDDDDGREEERSSAR